MRVIVHDYAGHPFQVELSRALAAAGHDVLHVYSASLETPRGGLERREDDPPGFDVRGVATSEPITMKKLFKRFQLEREYGRLIAEVCEEFRPDVVLTANTPSIVLDRLASWCRRKSIRFVAWIQDMYGLAAYRILGRRIPVLGHAVGKYFINLDRRALRSSHAVVVITEDFGPILKSWGVPGEKIEVVHNWAPLEELPTRPRENDWSAQQGLGERCRFVYTGTLAMKHNPGLLLDLLRKLHTTGDELIVVSQGDAVAWLADQAKAEGLENLKVLGFQPFEDMPDVLGSADVLVAILEPDAGVFAVPSKVLTYMCSSRPILAAIPGQNLAARLISESGAGVVVEPSDTDGFVQGAERLMSSESLREECGRAGRLFAEENFDIEAIRRRFEGILGIEQPVPHS